MGESSGTRLRPPSAATRRERVLSGGLVAHNEERTIARAVRSLLDQELPPGVRWGTVWVVASGCTDGTVPIAEELARRDPRIRVVVEATRRGKSQALSELFRRAEGDLLVLLNADAAAEPGAIAALLRASEGAPLPFAIMARPLPPPGTRSVLARIVDLLWTVHHEFHREIPAARDGSNLSDELLLLSLPQVPVLREGIINDGAYLGLTLLQNRGGVRYAPDAGVRISVPGTLRDYLRQRRRILVGYAQLGRELGGRPLTLGRLAFSDPRRALGVLRRSLRASGQRLSDLGALLLCEGAASLLAAWDALPPRADHVRWKRIGSDAPGLDGRSANAEPAPRPGDGPVGTGFTLSERRITALLRVAGRYRTGLSVDEILSLLPAEGPTRPEELAYWIGARPDLARLEGSLVYPSGIAPVAPAERKARAERYRSAAEELLRDHLSPVLPWVRCLGITGSTAYGAPEPGDDLDFFVVTRPGALWIFLTYSYLAVRFRFRPRAEEDRPMPCFNYVVDERNALGDFARPQGFLFAREALTTEILRGKEFYRTLLHAAPWLAEEIPRRYASRSGVEDPIVPTPAPIPLRVLNALLYPPVATYLHLVGLHRQARLRREGGGEGDFRVRTGPSRLAYVSNRFEELRHELGRHSATPPPSPRHSGPWSPGPAASPGIGSVASPSAGRVEPSIARTRRRSPSEIDLRPMPWAAGPAEDPSAPSPAGELRDERGVA